MNTFRDTIKNADNKDVLRKYIIEGTTIQLHAECFKSLIYDSIPEYRKITHRAGTGKSALLCKLVKLYDAIISVTITQSCDNCHGVGEFECDECDGHGEYECHECGSQVDCEVCDGTGIITCDYCSGEYFDENEILFYEEINVNQGELF